VANPETPIQNRIWHGLSERFPGLVLWRNNVGTAEFPDTAAGRTRVVTYGLCPGSADPLGLVNGRFLAIEVKTPSGRATRKQLDWLELVRPNGRIAFVATSLEDAVTQLTAAVGGGGK